MKQVLLFIVLTIALISCNSKKGVLDIDTYHYHFEKFILDDNELYKGSIPNDSSFVFLSENIPLFECPDKEIERTYYFRWWTYRKHIKETPEGFVITEFLPNVPWSGKYNTISCPAALHFYEGRWLRNQRFLEDYAVFWLRKGGSLRTYSFWIADALYNHFQVTGNPSLVLDLLPDLVNNYNEWEKERMSDSGLFWQEEGRDGMEESVCGTGYRATINSYMYADAKAISAIAHLRDTKELSVKYTAKAEAIKLTMQKVLWDREAEFYKVLPKDSTSLCNARELHGYTPWYFNLPDENYSVAWKFLMDSVYFFAPFGLTTVERCSPDFSISYEGHECQWNGPSWPYSTSITLTAMANLLNNYSQTYVNKSDYFNLLQIYSKSQHLTENGKTVLWIDENLNPFTGDWIARTRLKSWENGTWSKDKGGEERGKDYNHSTFCDLIISGLIGIRPQADNTLVVNPLVPEGEWDYFCLDRVHYHGLEVTVLYDKSGKRYGRGKGLRVLVNGEEKANSETLTKLNVYL